MRALVVYESMYGNTHLVADAIGRGLELAGDVTVRPVHEAGVDALDGLDLLVVGGPTHVHGMSRDRTRKAAVDAAATDESLDVEPGAEGDGIREWLAILPDSLPLAVHAAAFDTRIDAPAFLTGRASKAIDRALRRHGFDVIAEPESFLVTKHNELEADEASRATAWAAQLVALVEAGNTR
jgi:hypothetical protein